jgi:ABC-2 type transport system ATP-binding protein
MIDVQSVSKQYGLHSAVNKVSFSSTEGKIFGLLGPNGAGKSTVIKMLMNVLVPDSGCVLLDGKKISEKDKDRIGYLPEERGLYRNVRINEMLLYLASLKNGNTAAAEKNLDAWLVRFGLMDWKNRTAKTLSKGMSQKVQFIAAVLHNPDYLFFDEPFSGLDPISMELLKDAIVDLAAEGKNIILSTHNMEIAEKMCSSVLIMNHGRALLSGSMSDLKSKPGNKTVSVEFDGKLDGESLTHMTASISTFPRSTEIVLADGFEPESLLRKLMDQVTIRKFEILAPSLNKIYVDLVGDVAYA